MKKNFHYIITAVPAKSGVDIKNFQPYFSILKAAYNKHIVRQNPKVIDDISLSKKVKNGIVFDFWSEKKLHSGRELQSMKRISESLVYIDPSVVVGKSRVLVST